MQNLKQTIYKLLHPFFKLYWKIFKPKTSGARALLIFENQILLTKNINSKYWSLPGGKVDSNETPEICILRELKEELSLDNNVIDCKLGEYTSNNESKRDTVYVYVIHLQSLYFKKEWELQDAQWFMLSNLPEDISPATLRRIKEYRNQEKDIISKW